MRMWDVLPEPLQVQVYCLCYPLVSEGDYEDFVACMKQQLAALCPGSIGEFRDDWWRDGELDCNHARLYLASVSDLRVSE